MKAEQFTEELKRIENETREKIVNLVQQAQKDDGLEWDTDKPVSFVDNPNWNYPVDGLAELAGWTYDRLAGRNRLHRKSMTKRIRKALGYTYP